MATEAKKEETSYDDSPRGLAALWKFEIDAATKRLKDWREQGEKIVDRFRDEREQKTRGDTRWNLFSADTETKYSMLYGQTPRITVSRRFSDAGDDVARVAGEMLERLLNSEVERDGDTYAKVIAYAVQDRLLPGLAQARVRYEVELEEVEVEAQTDETGAVLAEGYSETQKKEEEAEVDYVHWKDFLWGPGRTWEEVRWVAFRAEMSRAELIKAFGEEVGKALPLNCGRAKDERRKEGESSDRPWHRAEVLEIWSKEHERVFHFVEGWPTILFHVDNPTGEDPLGLEGFFPCPEPILANVTTSDVMPRPDFVLAQDLYDEIDTISTRITLLEKAIRVAGLYDQGAGQTVGRLLSGVAKNEMFPVANWPAFSEKGGIKGLVDWLPLEQLVSALSVLRDYRSELIEAKHQITGMADIMRGQASTAGSSATEQAIKAKFGSVRMEKLQKEVARFASDLMKLKAQVISKHWDAQTIIERSNVMATPDRDVAEQAVALIKSGLAHYRIEVKPEAVALTDFAQLKSERTEVVGAIGQFLTAAQAFAAAMPGSMPMLLEMLQWLVAGMRGSSQIEGVLDRAVQAAQQMAQQPQQQVPDPKLMATQIKIQGDMAKEQAKLQGDLVRIQAEVAADGQREQTQAFWNTREAAQKAALNRAMKPPDTTNPFER